jgi:hypothetical protein
MDKTIEIVFVIILCIILVGTLVEVYVLYFNADKVECDILGNCIFSTTLRNETIIINQTCYMNGKMVDCPVREIEEMIK